MAINGSTDQVVVNMTSSDEDDLHMCGRCKAIFHSLEDYATHKTGNVCVPPQKRILEETSDDMEQTKPKQKRKRGRPFKYRNLPEHLKQLPQKIPIKKTYICPKCENCFDNCVEFDRHMRKRHNLSQHWCQKCRIPFCDKFKLKRHMTNCSVVGDNDGRTDLPTFIAFHNQSKKLFKSNEEDEDGMLNYDFKDFSDFSCRECDYECESFGNILIHVKVAHRVIKPGICKFCGHWFSSKAHLWRHIMSSLHDHLSDSEVAKVREEIQNKQFLWPDFRPDDQRNRKPAQKPINCNICGKTCVSKFYLEKHIQAAHHQFTEGHQCTRCNRGYQNERALKQHMTVVHSESTATASGGVIQNIDCEVCGISLKHSSRITLHMEKFHKPVLQGPIETLHTSQPLCNDSLLTKCFVCCKSVSASSDFVSHMHHHRVWVPHPEKGCNPPDLFSSRLTLNIDKSNVTRRYTEPSNEPDVEDPMESSTLNTIDHLTLTDLIDEIKEGNQFLAQPCNIPKNFEPCDNLVSRIKEPVAMEMNDECMLCSYCSSTYPNLRLLHHHKVNDHQLVLVFQCCHETCKMTFNSISEYYDHHTNVHPQRAYICFTCNYHTQDKGSLVSHQMMKHKRDKISLLCHLCNKKFPSKEDFLKHVDNEPSHFHCSVCLQVFKRKYDLEGHRAVHSDNRSLLCEICGSSFKSKVTLARHLSTHSARDFQCDKCDAAFHKNEYLQRHIACKHSDDKPFKCPVDGCDKSFKRKDKLKEHISSHSKERNHICNICGRRYRTRDGLKYHLKAHETSSAVTCTICGIETTRASQLRQHMKEVHSVAVKDSHIYHCSICTSSYSRPEAVKHHMEKEHKIRPEWSHVCQFCQKGFSGAKSLERHINAKHSSDKAEASAIKGQSIPNAVSTDSTWTTINITSATVTTPKELPAHSSVPEPISEPEPEHPPPPPPLTRAPDVTEAQCKLPRERAIRMTPVSAGTEVKSCKLPHERIIHIVNEKGERRAVNSTHGRGYNLKYSNGPPEERDVVQPLSTSHVNMITDTQTQRVIQPKLDYIQPPIQLQNPASGPVAINVAATSLQPQQSAGRFIILPSFHDPPKKTFIQPINQINQPQPVQTYIHDPSIISSQVLHPPIITPVQPVVPGDPVLSSTLPGPDDIRSEPQLYVPVSVIPSMPAPNPPIDNVQDRFLTLN